MNNATDIKKFRQELYKDETLAPDKIGGLFARGYVSIIASEPGAGKTWLTELLICQLSIGKANFWQDDSLNDSTENRPMKVLLLAGETGSSLLNQRLAQTDWEYETDNISIYNALDLAKHGVPYLLNTPEGKSTMLQIMQTERPDIVFIDTLISWHVADESKQAEMVDIYTYIMRIADVFKCAVVINHHTRKKSTTNTARTLTQDDVIGSSAGIRLARDVYILNKGHERAIILEHAKSWDKKNKTVSFKIVNDGWKLDLAFKQEERAKSTSEKFREFVDQLGDNSMISVTQTANYLQISPQLARHYFQKYTQEGILTEQTIGSLKVYKRAEERT